MSDVFAVDLALDLSPTLPEAVLAHLRRHVEGDSADDGSGEADWPDFVPLLADRGPAARIGGLLTGQLFQGADHWSLTARQEIHAELLPELVVHTVQAMASGPRGTIPSSSRERASFAVQYSEVRASVSEGRPTGRPGHQVSNSPNQARSSRCLGR